MLGRTLDWDEPLLQALAIEVEVRREGRPLFVATTWAGFIGVFTATLPGTGTVCVCVCVWWAGFIGVFTATLPGTVRYGTGTSTSSTRYDYLGTCASPVCLTGQLDMLAYSFFAGRLRG